MTETIDSQRQYILFLEKKIDIMWTAMFEERNTMKELDDRNQDLQDQVDHLGRMLDAVERPV